MSHEVQDVLVRLDGHVGRLFELLDAQVGSGRYTVVLTSDHGVARLPEQAGMEKGLAGRLPGAELRAAVEQALGRELGRGTYTAAYADGQIFLQAGLAATLQARPAAVQAVKAALFATGAVDRVFWREELTRIPPSADPFLEGWRLSYVDGRSGDFVVIPKRQWLFQKSGTNHGSAYEYDQRVPIIFFGAGIRPGRYTSTASPADIAPTLSALIGIEMPQAEGWVLREALIR
jgi:arylsulfatase A-like enzyme